jgi:hypothetical protein
MDFSTGFQFEAEAPQLFEIAEMRRKIEEKLSEMGKCL